MIENEVAPRRIPLSRPSFTEADRKAIALPLETGWVVQGPRVAEFETSFASYVGAQRALATTSCTTALHLAMASLGVGPGDEVIVPAFTWVATANAIEFVGGTPIFCDIDAATFNMDSAQLNQLITPRTVGILPVHLFGLPADMHTVTEIAASNGLWVVEDAACALGATIGGRHVGTYGRAACFSFHPRKSITTGEGGMVVTDDPKIALTVASLRDHGSDHRDPGRPPDPTDLGDFPRLGFNFRMTDMQGALGSSQLARADWILAERRRCAEMYDKLLADVDALVPPSRPADWQHGYQAYVCWYGRAVPPPEKVDEVGVNRDRVMRELAERGIGTRPGTHAPPFLGYYREKYGYRPGDFPVAFAAEKLTIALPLFADLSDDDISYVVESLRAVAT